MKDYAKLKELLETQETFPLQFTYKFIGQNTDAFARAVDGLERAFPGLQHEVSRESGGGKHLAKTYSFSAPNAEAVVAVYCAIEKLEGVLIVL